jgi:MoxR-like ATPase
VVGMSRTQNLGAGINRVVSVPYDGTIHCVTVQNHVILVERDGRLAWCGNSVPDGWFIWAAGNRKEDRAAVYDMPSPLANRFVHLLVEPDFESFKAYALANEVHEQILAFLSFRPELLHKLDAHQPAWPSPRSWMMASTLHKVGLDIATVIGAGAANELIAYVAVYTQLPDIERILTGSGTYVKFPSEPSVRYATTIGLTMRASSVEQSYNAFRWLADRAGAEWVQLFAVDLIRRAKARNQLGLVATLAKQDARLRKFYHDYDALVAESGG